MIVSNSVTLNGRPLTVRCYRYGRELTEAELRQLAADVNLRSLQEIVDYCEAAELVYVERDYDAISRATWAAHRAECNRPTCYCRKD